MAAPSVSATDELDDELDDELLVLLDAEELSGAEDTLEFDGVLDTEEVLGADELDELLGTDDELEADDRSGVDDVLGADETLEIEDKVDTDDALETGALLVDELVDTGGKLDDGVELPPPPPPPQALRARPHATATTSVLKSMNKFPMV